MHTDTPGSNGTNVRRNGDESIRPNAVTYMLVCQALADRYNHDLTGESPNMAEQTLQRMKKRTKHLHFLASQSYHNDSASFMRSQFIASRADHGLAENHVCY
jgi:hypothetical protein